MTKLLDVRRRPTKMLALVHDEPITMRTFAGELMHGRVQLIDPETRASWLLTDETELWTHYELEDDAALPAGAAAGLDARGSDARGERNADKA